MLNHASYVNKEQIKPLVLSQPKKTLNNVTMLAIICFAAFVAFFDFTIFIFSADTINSVFFPDQDSTLITRCQTMALAATGFIARPVGAWFIGRYGDKRGRKRALHLSMWLFLISAAIASILPTYTQIGLFAPLLLILLRLMQGAAFAAQLVIGWIFLAESLPKNRLARGISLNLTAVFLGSIACSNLYYFLEGQLSSDAMLSYGWRLMFVVSFLLSLLAFLLIRKLTETPLFYLKQCLPASSSPGLPMTSNCVCDSATPDKTLDDIKEPSVISADYYFNFNHFNAVLMTVVLALIGTSLGLMITVLLPQLLMLTYSIEPTLLHTANTAGITGLIIGVLFYGYIADKFGVSKALMGGALLLMLVAIGFYNYCANSTISLLVPFYGFLGFASGIDVLCMYIMIRLFPIHQRLTWTGVIFNTVTVFTGAILPFALAYVTDIFTFAPAFYIVFICMCAYLIGFYLYQSPDIYEIETLPKAHQ